MNSNLKDILSGLNKDIEQEKLIQYLNRTLSDADQHAIEAQMNDDAFISDGIEGLQSLENTNTLNVLINQMNADLKKQLKKKNKRKDKRKLKEQPWVYFSILLLMLLIVVAYIVIKKLV